MDLESMGPSQIEKEEGTNSHNIRYPRMLLLLKKTRGSLSMKQQDKGAVVPA